MQVSLKRYSLLLIWSCCLGAGNTHGDALNEADVLGDIAQVSIASHFDQALNRVPASVTIIDRALLDASGAQTWADIFRMVPGFQSYSVNGNRYGVSYHGFGKEYPNRLEVMVDGRSVYEPIFSAVQWGALGVNFQDIERIEIVRGPSTPSQGSNALLGAVNIITRAPIQDSGTALTYTSGARSTRNTTLRHSDQIGEMFYRLSLGYQHNSGFPSVPGPNGGPLDDGRELYQLAFRGTLTPSLRDSLDISVGLVDNREGLGDGDHPDEYVEAEYDSNYQSAVWTRALASGDQLRLRAYHNSLRLGHSAELGLISEIIDVPPAFVPLILGGVQDQVVLGGLGSLSSERFDLELEQRFARWGDLQAMWGLGLRAESVRSELLFNHGDKIREESFRLFSHNEWLLTDDWAFNFGVMIEDGHVGVLISPRLGLNYTVLPNHSLRWVLGHSERSPSITETNANQILELDGYSYDAVLRADANLGEESVDHVELGYVGRFPRANIELDVSVFREQARDGIDAYEEDVLLDIPHFDNTIKVTSNTGEWETTGAELQLSYRPVSGSLLRIHYTYLDLESDFIRRFEPALLKADFNDSRPRHSGGLLLAHQLTPRVDGSVMTYYQSDANWRGGNPINEFVRIDAQLGYKFKAGRSGAKIQAIAQNIGGEYSAFSQNNVFESRFYIKVELDLL